MKKALISPNENNRIAQVADAEFEVAQPLHWVDCPDEVIADLWTYLDGQFVEPAPIEEVQISEKGASA